jgi:hypothetical protein
MKKSISSFALALLTAFPLAGFAQNNLEKDPAYLPIDKVIDLKTIRPEVNVNLPHFLLKDALSELNSPGNGSPVEGMDIADLIKDVKLIRVVVINANHTTRATLDKAMKTLRDELEKKWTTIVSVPEEKEHVGVYAMSDPAGESTTGLAVLVFDGNDAVIGNIVGRVSIGKLVKIASQSGKLPKDFLKKLQGLGNQTNEPPAKADDGSKNNAEGGAPKTSAEGSAGK